MELDLSGKTWCSLGLKGTGKSTLANSFLNTYGSEALYYDTLHEAPVDSPFDIYQPSSRYSAAPLETVIKAITPKDATEIPKYRLFVIDEANRFCPPKPSPLPPSVADLNDQARHYLMSVGYIARRPSQLNSDLMELADYLFIFRLTGKGDQIYLNNTVGGLGDAVLHLPDFHFIIVFPDKHFTLAEPITPDKTWLQHSKRLINR